MAANESNFQSPPTTLANTDVVVAFVQDVNVLMIDWCLT